MAYERKTRDIAHTGMGDDVRVSKKLTRKGAAEKVAGILAQREYGTSCALGSLQLASESVTSDGIVDCATFQAVIGRRKRDGSIDGRNVWIYT